MGIINLAFCLECIDEFCDHKLRHLLNGLPNSGQGRLHNFGHENIVKPDNGKIFWYPITKISRACTGSDRVHIVDSKNCRGRIIQR